MNGLVFTVSV